MERLQDRAGWYGPEPPGRKGWDRWPLRATAIAALLLGTTFASVVAVNPRGEMPWHPVEPLVQDVPYVKLGLYSARDPPPTALILGTSRGMVLPPAGLDGGNGTAFNFAFPGGEPMASELVYDYVTRTAGPPDLVVYALDQFAVRQQQPPRILESGAYPTLAQRERTVPELVAAMPGMLTPGAIVDTAEVLRRELTGTAGPREGTTLRPDGHSNRTVLESKIVDGAYNFTEAMEAHYARVILEVYDFERHADEAETRRIAGFLGKMLAQGTTVKVVLPPFHPVVLDRIEGLPTFTHYQEATLATLRDSCAQGLEVYDYTRIESFNGTSWAFYDGYHVTDTNARLVLRAVEEKRGDLCADRAPDAEEAGA